VTYPEDLAVMSPEIPSSIKGLLGSTEQSAAETPALSPESRAEPPAAEDPPAGEPFAFDPGDEVEELVQSLALRAHAAGLELVCRVGAGLPPRVFGSPVWLRQALGQLVANAIQFTERGEVVVEALPALAPSTPAPEDETWLHLAVRDTGIGIASDRLQLLLVPDAVERPPGRGIPQALRLVQGLGGRLEIDSVVGQGSTVRFTARFGVAASTAPSVPAHLQGRAVLFADDNATTRQLLLHLAQSWGLEPTLADSGPAALDALRRAYAQGRQFDALVIDTRMQPPAGFTVAERLKDTPSLSLPVILLAVPPCRKGDDAASVRLGVAARVSKPIRRAELLRHLAAVLAPRPTPAPTAPRL
jgi:CheY-like chemotaxis protein